MGIGGAGTGFGMKLDGHPGFILVADAFVRMVVGISEPRFESWGEFIYSETMILGGQKAAGAVFQNTRLVLAPVAVFHFIGSTSGGEG